MGKLAAEKGGFQPIIDFGRSLSDERTEIQKRVIDLASDRNIALGQANQTRTEQDAQRRRTAILGKLQALKNPDLDRRLMERVVSEGKNTLRLLQAAIPRLGNAPDVRTLISDTIPVIEKENGEASKLLETPLGPAEGT